MKHLRVYRSIALMLIFLLCLAYPAGAVSGDEFDPNAKSTLTIVDRMEDTPISGATFRLYKVADVTKNLELIETESFRNTGVSITNDESSWADQASTLEAYVIQCSAEGQAIESAASGTTDSLGELVFSNLPSGLYLLVSDQVSQGNTIYKSSAALLMLPYQELDGSWSSDETVYAKNSSRQTRNTLVDLTVVKVWQDSGYAENRPQSVSVTLYQDEEAFESVILGESNSWRYTWENLDAMRDYYVVEQNVPTGYTVTTVQEGTTFVVTNTYTPPASPTPPDTPDNTPTNTPTGTPNSNTKLPQTGQLWWPVTIMALLGLTLFVLGWGIHRRGGHK